MIEKIRSTVAEANDIYTNRNRLHFRVINVCVSPTFGEQKQNEKATQAVVEIEKLVRSQIKSQLGNIL